MRVCVVGAGASGLPALKSCLEEGLDAICYERSTDIGGLWRYKPNNAANPKYHEGTVMKSTVVNTSKEMMAYSDFPPPTDWPNFMHHTLVNEYLHRYADHFNLWPKIRLNSGVERIAQTSEGGWKVTLEDGSEEGFDKIMVCTGHHADPLYPQLRDIDRFRGERLHAHEYREPSPYKDKNVVIMGIGNSALDIAVDLAKIAKSVTVSTRRGSWIFNRVSQGGMPYDTIYMTRFYSLLMDKLPWTVANDFMEHRLQQRMDHDLYGLRPSHRFFQQHPTVNDALANLIASGYISIVDDVDSFEQDAVIVKGGKRYAADVFIMATGYTFDWPFLDRSIIPKKGREVTLYKYVFPVENKSIAIIGLVQPIGSIAPIAEMQSRWVTRVFGGKRSLPSRREQLADIDRKRALMKRRYFASDKHTVQVDYMKYMDELAEIVGCKPDLRRYFFESPSFWLRLVGGANAPYVYRLEGPNRWKGAREAIETVPDRVKAPLKNRSCRIRRHKRRGRMDEYFRYGSMKWLAHWTLIILFAGALSSFLFAWNSVVGLASLFVYIALFTLAYTFMLLWFDFQYDMTTIL